MPISAVMGPRDLPSGQFNGLSCDLDGSLELALKNLAENGACVDLGANGDPAGIPIPMPDPPYGRNWYLSTNGGDASTMEQQNGDALALGRPGFLFAQERYDGDRPERDPRNAAPLPKPPAPLVITVPKAVVGYKSGVYYLCFSYVVNGRHTLLSDPVKFEIVGDGRAFTVALPPEVPDGVRVVGIWLSEAAPLNTEPQISTLRLQREVPVASRTYRMTGPWRAVRRAPTRNETYLGRSGVPVATLENGAGNLASGAWAFGVTIVTPFGQTALGPLTRERRIPATTRTETVVTDNGDGTRTTTATRTVLPYQRNKAFHVRPNGSYPHARGFRVWARRDGFFYVCFNVNSPAGAESYTAFKEAQQRKGRPLIEGDRDTLREVIVYGEPEEGATGQRWVAVQADPPLEDTSGVPAPEGAPDAPVVDPTTPPTLPAGTYLVAMDEETDDGRKSLLSPHVAITLPDVGQGQTNRAIYAAHRDPVNQIINAQVREWLAPDPANGGEVVPAAWRGLWANQHGIEAAGTLLQGRSVGSNGAPTITTDGPAGFSGTTNVHTRGLEMEYDVPVTRDGDTWISADLTGQVLAGRAVLMLMERNGAGAVFNTRHLAAMDVGQPTQRLNLLMGPNGQPWLDETVSARLKLVFTKTGGVLASTVNGTVSVEHLLWHPSMGKPPRFVPVAPAPGTATDPKAFPEDHYPSYAARTVAPPEDVPKRSTVAYLALEGFEGQVAGAAPSSPSLAFSRFSNGVATPESNAALVSRVDPAAAVDGVLGWRVEDNSSAARNAAYATYTAPARRSSAAERVKIRVRQLPTRSQVMLMHFYGSTKTILSLALTSTGTLTATNMNGQVSTVATGVRAGDALDLEAVLLGSGGAGAKVYVFLGKNGATRGQIWFSSGNNFSGQFFSSGSVGLVYENDPAATCKLDFDYVSFTPLGDSLGTPGSLGGEPLPRPDRPQRDPVVLYRVGMEPAEGTQPAPGWTPSGTATLTWITSPPIEGTRSLRISGVAPGTEKRYARAFPSPSSLGVRHKVGLRAVAATGDLILQGAVSGGVRVAEVVVRSGRLVCRVRSAAGAVVDTMDVGPVAAHATAHHAVELRLTGIGTTSGAVEVWYAPPGQPKEVWGQKGAVDWTGLSGATAEFGAYAPTSSGWTVDVDAVVVTEDGETVFREEFRALGAADVVDSLGFEDGGFGDWSPTHAPRGPLSTQIVTGQAALSGELGWRIRDDDAAAGSTIFLSKTYPTGAGDLLGVRLQVGPNRVPATGFVSLAWLLDGGGAELGRLEAGEGELRLRAPGVSGGVETRMLMPLAPSSDPVEVELMAIDAGTGDGVLRASARRVGGEGRYVSEVAGLDWTGRWGRTVRFGVVAFTDPASRWEFDFDRADVLRREETAPEPVRQIGLFFPPDSSVAQDAGPQMRFVVLPGLTYKAGVFARWLRSVGAAGSFPYWLSLHDDAGRTIELGSPFGGGSSGNPAMNGISGNSGGWRHYETQAFTVPDGFFELRVRCKDMGAMYFLSQEFALSPGASVDRSPGRALRGSFDSHLSMLTPQEESGVYGEWRGVDEGVVSAPDGAAYSATYRTTHDPARLSWTPPEKDPALVPPGLIAHLRLDLYGDGSATPRVAPGGPKIAYRKMEETMTREDRSELPGGLLVKKVQFSTLMPDYEAEWTEGGDLQVLPSTPPLGRIEPFTVYAFTEAGAKELRETSAGGIFWLEVRRRLVKVRFKDAIPMTIRPETEVTVDGVVYHVWGEGQTSLAQVLDEGDLP